jgi:hypothetical protein
MNRLVGRDLLKDAVKLHLCREIPPLKVRHVAMNHDEAMTTAEAILTNKVIAKVTVHLGHNKILH